MYEAIIDDLAAHGGEVLYFSGDAITCWLDGDIGSHAIRCALDMQKTMRAVGDIELGDRRISLSIKIAVAVGEARRFAVGDPDVQRIDLLTGRLIDRLAEAEGVAERGDVIADGSVLASLGDALVCSGFRVDPDTDRSYGVVERLDAPVAEIERTPLASLSLDAARPWLLPDVFDRLVVGGGTFLGELRTAFPIFVRFGGFDFDNDPLVADRVDAFVQAAQRVFDEFDGTLLGITVGDKGAYLVAVVGALRSHEDDAHRSVAAAMALRDLEISTDAVDLQVGVSVGQVYCGAYGHTDRRTFSVLGDPMNVAARLMMKASPGEVYVLGDVADAVEDRFAWTDAAALELKGKLEPVIARVPVVARPGETRRIRRYDLPMVGRNRELAIGLEHLTAVRTGERRVLSVSGDAGMGKSRLVAELLRLADRVETPVQYGQAESLGRTTSYVVWRGVWRQLFGLDDEASDSEQARSVYRVLHSISPVMAQRTPLLGNVLGIEIEDNEFVAHFDAKLRRTSLENLLADLLAAKALDGPLIVVLEDLQWIDPPSVDLLRHLVRATGGLPVLFLLSYRIEDQDPVPPEVAELDGFERIVLDELDRHGMSSVVNTKVNQVFGDDVEPSEALVELVLDRAQGNPFYAEEIVNFVRRQGLDPSDATSVDRIALPDSLNAIVLGRIDGLDERPRQAVKVASIVGRQFEAALVGAVHDALGDGAELVGHLETARRSDLVVPETEDLAGWLFRHAITRDVAYESLPFSIRRQMHERIGDAIVEMEGTGVMLDLLAHHYWHADNVDKQRQYLRLAGDAARAAYANEAAIEHYRRLAQVVADRERAEALLDLAGVHELTGDWQAAMSVATEARGLAASHRAEDLEGWCNVALAESERKQGRYDAAVELLEQARNTFEGIADDAGIARVFHLLGTVAAQHGELTVARGHYEQSRVIRERLVDVQGLAGLLSNLGVVAEYEGEYDESIRHHRRALDLREQSGDRWAIAVSQTNLGTIAIHQERYAEARQWFEEAMRLNREVGDAWMVAIAHNNLGNAERGLGNNGTARRHYFISLAAYRNYGDKWALAFLFEDIAMLAAQLDPLLSLRLLGVADRWRTEISVPRPATLEAMIEQRIDASLTTMSADERTIERRRGSGWTDDAGYEAAERFCGGRRER